MGRIEFPLHTAAKQHQKKNRKKNMVGKIPLIFGLLYNVFAIPHYTTTQHKNDNTLRRGPNAIQLVKTQHRNGDNAFRMKMTEIE